MNGLSIPRSRSRWLALPGLLVFAAALAASGCQPGVIFSGSPVLVAEPGASAGPGNRLAPTAAEAAGSATQAYTAQLEISPSAAEVGATVALRGSGYDPGADVELVWYSVEGRYEFDGLELVGQRFDLSSRMLATVRADESGEIASRLVVPFDFGGMHDLRARVEGKEIAQTALTILPTFSISPREGPVGTPIEVRITGVDWREQINSWPILYDNRPVGIVTAVTTQGVAIGRLRASGPVGNHYLSIWHNSVYPTPFLNYRDGAFRDVPGAELTFRVTSDPGPGSPVIEYGLAGGDAFPPAAQNPAAGPARLTVNPDRGTVGQKLALRGGGLPGGSRLKLTWGTMRRSWAAAAFSPQARMESTQPLAEVETAPDGTFGAQVAIPDDLGGVHRVDVVVNDKPIASAFVFVQPSLVSFGPTKAHEGEEIRIRVNGLSAANFNTNVYAVTYDNAQIGYICGSSAGGEVEFTVRATGGSGTHLIDLYPFIWKSRDQATDAMPRIYGVPLLTYARDHPWRVTPAMRLAFEIVP